MKARRRRPTFIQVNFAWLSARAAALYKEVVALRKRADRELGPDRSRLFGEVASSLRSILKECPREGQPRQWATTQTNLAFTLHSQALASKEPEKSRLFTEEIVAWQSALEVRTRKAFPRDWAVIHEHLASVRCFQAQRAEGTERRILLGEAAAAFRAALQVWTREAWPLEWADTQIDLVFSQLGATSGEGAEFIRLLGEAASAYRDATEVYTRETAPESWAIKQSCLGTALRHQAEWAEGPERFRLLGEAIAADRAALEVITKDYTPHMIWIGCLGELTAALSEQLDAAAGPDQARLLDEALAAHRTMQEIYNAPKTSFPSTHRAFMKTCWALVLKNQALSSNGEERARYFNEAKEAYLASLAVFTQEKFPDEYGKIRAKLAKLEMLVGEGNS